MLQFHSNRMLGMAFAYHGMAIPHSQGLKLVFREADASPETATEECEKFELNWNQVKSIGIERGLWGGRVILNIVEGEALSTLPFYRDNKVILEVYSKHIDQLEPFQERAERFRQGNIQDDVDDVIDDVRSFLDGMHREIFGKDE